MSFLSRLKSSKSLNKDLCEIEKRETQKDYVLRSEDSKDTT